MSTFLEPELSPVEPAPGERGGSRELLRLAFPVMLTQVSQTLMALIDAIFVGRLGATELGAVGLGGVWLWTTFNLFFGTAVGLQTFVSQTDGAGRSHACGMWLWQALYAVLPLAALGAVLLAPFIEPALALIGGSEELRGAAASYMGPRLPGEVGIVLFILLSAFFRGLGEMRLPLYATLVGILVNVVLDYGLIFGELGFPELGIAGAGYATSSAAWVEAVLLTILLARREFAREFATAPWRPSWKRMRRYYWTALPMGGQWFLGGSAFAVFTAVIARLGDTAMAASQAFLVLTNITFMAAYGLSIAVSTLVGRYIGARDYPSAERAVRSSIAVTVPLSGLMAAVFVLAPETLMGLFTGDPEVLREGVSLLMVGALFLFVDALQIVMQGALRGAGDTRWCLVLEFLLAWCLWIPLGAWFAFTLDLGLIGAWCAGLIFVFTLALGLWLRFRSGAWKQIQI